MSGTMSRVLDVGFGTDWIGFGGFGCVIDGDERDCRGCCS